MHLPRLLTDCAILLETGAVMADVGPHRERPMARTARRADLDEVCCRRDRRTARLEAAVRNRRLSVESDAVGVEDLLVSVRRRSSPSRRDVVSRVTS